MLKFVREKLLANLRLERVDRVCEEDLVYSKKKKKKNKYTAVSRLAKRGSLRREAIATCHCSDTSNLIVSHRAKHGIDTGSLAVSDRELHDSLSGHEYDARVIRGALPVASLRLRHGIFHGIPLSM